MEALTTHRNQLSSPQRHRLRLLGSQVRDVQAFLWRLRQRGLIQWQCMIFQGKQFCFSGGLKAYAYLLFKLSFSKLNFAYSYSYRIISYPPWFCLWSCSWLRSWSWVPPRKGNHYYILLLFLLFLNQGVNWININKLDIDFINYS